MAISGVLGQAAAGAGEAAAVNDGMKEINDFIKGVEARNKYHGTGVKNAVNSIE